MKINRIIIAKQIENNFEYIHIFKHISSFKITKDYLIIRNGFWWDIEKSEAVNIKGYSRIEIINNDFYVWIK